MARDLVFFGHIILGLALVVLPILILLFLKDQKSVLTKPLAAAAAIISWIMLVPAGNLYIIFYPATKTLIKAGSRPWAHSIIMETKEHWGLLIPVVATVAAWAVFTNRQEQSRKWWILLMILTILMAVLGRVIKMGAVA